MNSHRSEIYGVLSALLFLHEYCHFFMIPLSTRVKYFYDNLEVVNKIKKLIKDEQYYDEYIKTADHYAVHLLKHDIPRQFTIKHVRSHQDKRKKKSQLTTTERLNIAADELVGSTSSKPANSHIDTSFALYLDGIYLPNHYRNKIRSSSGAREARKFLKEKYNLTSRLIDLLEWKLVFSFISQQTYETRKTMIKYSHRWLLSNSTTTDSQMICPYCLRSEETLDHDHFLTCNESEERKEVRIKSCSQLLTQLQTPSSLTTLLINGLYLAYQEYHQPTDQSSPTQQHAIGWNHFIRGIISTELTKTTTTHYKSSTQSNQRFTGKG